MGWTQFIIWVVCTIISYALAPKPPKPKKAALEDFELPTAEEGRPIPVVFGTVDVGGANVLWYGDLKAKGLSNDMGFKYYLGMHFGICHGPVNKISRISIAEKTAWTGSITSSATAVVTQGKLFGGSKREGGWIGNFDFEFGGPTQVTNTYLTAAIGGSLPAYRGILGCVFHAVDDPVLGHMNEGGYVGTTPYIKGVSFRVSRTTAGWDNDSCWYSAKATIDTDHANPAHIVYEAMTNPEWGMGLPVGLMNDTAWRAAADTLYSEGFGLSLIWNQQTTVEDFCQQILDHIGGMVVFHLETGTYELRLIRGGYDAGTLPLFDESNVVKLAKREIRGWGETVNEVALVYTDHDTGKDTSIVVQDLANIALQGRIAETVQLPGIRDPDIAAAVAQRELISRATPMALLTMDVNRDAWDTSQGDLFRLSWDAYGLTEVVFRVLKITKGSLEDGTITIDALQDVYGVDAGVYVVNPDADAEPTTTEEGTQTSSATSVKSTTTTAPPASPTDGDTYYVPSGATGAWSGHAGEVATWDDDANEWTFEAVNPSALVYDEGSDAYVNLIGDGTTNAAPWTSPEGSGAQVVIYKDADQSIYNSNALTNDTKLQVALEAASTYLIEMDIHDAIYGTPDMKTAVAYTGTVADFKGHYYRFNTAGEVSAVFKWDLTLGAAVTWATTGNPANGVAHYSLVLATTTSGTFSFQFAQSAPNATYPATVKRGSWMRVTKF